MQARNRAGWMLTSVAKPTTHPARRPSAYAVTTNTGAANVPERGKARSAFDASGVSSIPA